MKDKIYIHYGHKEFDKNLFNNIKQTDCLSKPIYGFWASPVDALYGWKDWNEDEEFREYDEENSFLFTLPDAKILYISSVDDLSNVPMKNEPTLGWVVPDFIELQNRGYDAVEVSISSDNRLYWKLYGWDCDSIVIMNPEVVKQYSRNLHVL